MSSSSNHPRFLILDEPQQQSVEDANFLEMLKHAASIPDCQVLIATSHEREGIAALAAALPLIHLWELGDGRLITQNRVAATVSEFLTVGFSYPHIPNHRRARSWSQNSVFAKKNPRSGKR